MFFQVDVSNGVPIYEQLIRQVKYAVADGSLTPGQMVPSVRQLSQELALNPNTIARAYQQLQSDRVLESLRGRGLVVRRDAATRCIKARQEMIALRLRFVVREALVSGYSESEIRSLFEAELSAEQK